MRTTEEGGRLPLDGQLLSVEDLSRLLQVPVRTIYQWRLRGEGPRSMRIGRYLRFDPHDVRRWLESRKNRF